MDGSLRTLTAAELRLLKSALAFRQRQLKRIKRSMLVLWIIFLAGLLALTFFASSLPWQAVLIAWIAYGAIIPAWSYFSARREVLPTVAGLESAVRRNQARVVRVQSNEMVDFEEEEDEGATYAFQIEGRQIIFITGQDYYPSVRFPNSDFSLVEILAEDGSVVEGSVVKQGEKLRPLRTIPADIKSKLRIPDHLETISGRLDELEQLLRQ